MRKSKMKYVGTTPGGKALYSFPRGVLRNESGAVVRVSPLYLEGILLLHYPWLACRLHELYLALKKMFDTHPVITFLGFYFLFFGLLQIFIELYCL